MSWERVLGEGPGKEYRERFLGEGTERRSWEVVLAENPGCALFQGRQHTVRVDGHDGTVVNVPQERPGPARCLNRVPVRLGQLIGPRQDQLAPRLSDGHALLDMHLLVFVESRLQLIRLALAVVRVSDAVGRAIHRGARAHGAKQQGAWQAARRGQARTEERMRSNRIAKLLASSEDPCPLPLPSVPQALVL